MMALAVLGHALELFDEGLARLDAEHAVLVERRVALHGQDVLTLVLGHDLVEDGLGLVAGGGHQGVVVVQRDHRQHHVLGQRVGAADEAPEQQVHSSPCSHSTGVRGLVSIAWAICGTNDGPGPARSRSASSTS
jgi:hypothetical protein